MKSKFLIWLQEKLANLSDAPWACFETTGVDGEGRIGWSMRWNKAFIAQLNARGYQSTSDEETVQTFFIGCQMLPESLYGEEIVNPAATPNLSNEANILKR